MLGRNLNLSLLTNNIGKNESSVGLSIHLSISNETSMWNKQSDLIATKKTDFVQNPTHDFLA